MAYETTDTSALLIGRTLGGARIVSVVGGGAMGTVYRGVQDRLKASVAVKVIRPEFVQNKDVVARFEREAREIARLRGKTNHVVQIYDFGRDEETGVYFITMELVEGEGLDKVLRRVAKFNEPEALRVARQAAAGLEAAREHGLVHRDIKPGNLLLGPGGVVKITDFGLARGQADEDTNQVTRSGQVFGTVAYMSPQQADGLELDHRNDIYSLGATIYALVAGETPFKGPTPIMMLMQHMQQPVPDPRDAGAAISPEFSAVIQKMLAKSPTARYQTAGEVVADLDAIVALDPATAARSDQQILAHLVASRTDAETMLFGTTPMTVIPTASPWAKRARRRRLAFGALGATVVVLAGLLGWRVLGTAGAGSGTGSGTATPLAAPTVSIRLDEPAPGSVCTAAEVQVKAWVVGTEKGAWVRVNGVAATLTRDLVNATVTLAEGPQEIVIEAGLGPATSAPKDRLPIPVTVDLSDPVLAVEEPRDDAATAAATIAVAGTVSDLTLRSLRVLGRDVPVTDGTFRLDVPLAEGPNTITVEAEDRAGRRTLRTRRVLRDSEPPVLGLEGEGPQEVEQREFLLRGLVRDAALDRVEVSGVAVTPDAKGQFERRLVLEPGENPVRVTARDRAGQQVEKHAMLIYKPLPEGLAIGAEAGTYRGVRDGVVLVRVAGGAPLWMDRDEVTVKAYGTFLAALSVAGEAGRNPHAACAPDEPPGKDHTPADWLKQRVPGRERLPVVGVDWWDAVAYARWAGRDLPTAAEWTAAAGGGALAFPWGEASPDGDRAVFGRRAGARTSGPDPTGTHPAGNAACGARDLAGNVAEWCLDGGADAEHRVVRGGSWADAADACRVGASRQELAGDRMHTVGFRCVMRAPMGSGERGGD